MPRARPARLPLLAVAILAAAALAVPGVRDTLRGLAKEAAGWPARWQRRALLGPEEPAFSRLAASQVGYAPGMAKRFSAPRPFQGFRVVRVADGAEVLRVDAPGRRIESAAVAGGEAFVGDLTALTAPGRYRVEAAGLASLPFDVGPGVFDAAARAVQRAFLYQRAFTALEPAHAAGPWVHASDAHLAPPGVRGGWHDAGDFSLYSASTAVALEWMLDTWRDLAPADDDLGLPESGNGVPDLLDEARRGLEWMLSVEDGAGGFAGTTCQDRYGPYGTNRYESVPPYRAGEVGALATARATAVLASATPVYRPYDPAFADQLLAAARRGFAWLEARPDDASDGPSCPAYRFDGDRAIGREVRAWAAAGLLLATGEPRFLAAYAATAPPLEGRPSFIHPAGFAALTYLRAPSGDPAVKAGIRAWMRRNADAALAEGAAHPFERAAPTFWGSNGAGFVWTNASSARFCLADRVRYAADCEQALANVHYVLGRNSLHLAYVTGLPGVTRARVRGFHQWLAALRAEPFDFPGMVAGGPNSAPEPLDVSLPHQRPVPFWGYLGDPAFPRGPATPPDGRFTDNDSWSTNELSLDWQASSLYALHLARWLAREGR
ncbi:MAG: glycoside hydrolase family 9 protein [Anaeromyxobacteraceae bacterium]